MASHPAARGRQARGWCKKKNKNTGANGDPRGGARHLLFKPHDLIGVRDAELPDLLHQGGALPHGHLVALAAGEEVQVLVLEVWVVQNQVLWRGARASRRGRPRWAPSHPPSSPRLVSASRPGPPLRMGDPPAPPPKAGPAPAPYSTPRLDGARPGPQRSPISRRRRVFSGLPSRMCVSSSGLKLADARSRRRSWFMATAIGGSGGRGGVDEGCRDLRRGPARGAAPGPRESPPPGRAGPPLPLPRGCRACERPP